MAGGTGLALQIGHRDSVDFDFFTYGHFETRKLYNQVCEIFAGRTIEKTQEEKDTLSVIIDGELKISFFGYSYQTINALVKDTHFDIASIPDIACMKLSAITGRSVLKDYIDLYFILRLHPLSEILAFLAKKMPDQDQNLVLKCLTYFDDVTKEKIIFKNRSDVSLDTIKKFFTAEVKKLYRR